MPCHPTIGLIVPPAAGAVPRDGPELYPGVRFEAVGLGLTELSVGGYDGVIELVGSCAEQLAAGGADAVSLMGTSLSFYRGSAFNAELTERMATATGLPVTTMSTAVLRALRTLGAQRVAVATAYSVDVTERLRDFLTAAGLTVTAVACLDVRSVAAIAAVGDAAVERVAAQALGDGGAADSLLISCGGLDTLHLLAPLEDRFGVAVVASSPTGFWDAVQLAGIDPTVPGYGRLFAA